MKIYNKKVFYSGIGMVLLGSLNLFINIVQKDVDATTIILFIILGIFGLNAILRSLSRKKTKEDKLEILDERNQLIELKSQSKSFQITQNAFFLLMFVLMIMGKISGNKDFITMGVGISFAIVISMFAEIFSKIYYESNI
ncbi:DUF2178 domain-containing protein [Peptacetobacter sp.]|uniref:DUF2178 domain-containing protein n=1 Tax=Peptacetobacter sp. TaxID=2991975 RepID=UPI002E7AA1A7|nr:DUF2178 domain-containing protein [Peptacetobacter sp.]MEE0451066.1 DUF2178 domain-containing protein [Peptacetobacter sp.]